MRKLFLTGLLLLALGFAYSAPVDMISAKKLARNFWFAKASALMPVKYADVNVREVITENIGSEAMFYAVNFYNGGFVLIAADDIVYPFLGYSFEGFYSRNNQSPAFLNWIERYKLQISYNKNMGSTATSEIKAMWQQYQNVAAPDVKDSKAIEPLCLSNWNQDGMYNQLCPADPNGPGGHAYAGCVATAMAQIMYYWRWPVTGQGSHSYSSNYGTLSVNPGTTTYGWNGMVNSCSSANTPVNTLIYHCGVTVNMDYSASGSGASTSTAASAMTSHFRYSSSISDESKDSYSTTAWASLLRTNLDAKHPMLYSGYDVNGAGGHAWVCDGYQGTDYFHMNWGWGGSGNGYFYLTNLNAPGYNFTDWQGAVVNIFPSTGYPVGCTGTTTLTTTEGTITDGSGPAASYSANSDCMWLISPGTQYDKITLTFNQFETESGNDLVTVYDGSTTSSPVLGTYSGSTLPSAISSNGPAMLVRFTTNASTQSSGWFASYKAYLPVYCTGVETLTAASDTFSDGSGNNSYNANSNCKWQINPTGATTITLTFTEFNTESGTDLVKVYNASAVPSVLLGTFSGSTLPTPVTCNCSQMMVMFNSNATTQNSGFTAYYTSAVGVEDNNPLPQTSVSVYPVPANKNITLSLELAAVSNAEVHIVDLLGKPVYKELIRDASGDFQKNIDVSTFAEGIYFVKVSIGKELFTKKMIIQR